MALTWISGIRYIPTEINVADIGTRGASPPCLDRDSFWQLGPAFLRDPENKWPQGPTEQVCTDPSELRKSAHSGTVCVFSESSLIDLADYSALWKAKRVVTCVLRCVQKFKSTLTKASALVKSFSNCGRTSASWECSYTHYSVKVIWPWNWLLSSRRAYTQEL